MSKHTNTVMHNDFHSLKLHYQQYSMDQSIFFSSKQGIIFQTAPR